ncbi:protein lethal(2)k10201 [Anopheles bellator]|uniref:protein lethal(2)k10201 n=1 Tax=Anopheles bellator TaxID=139047 RepID=UPI0026473218|nr:protein lethal(2)k10201 [Anopheles bellator]
MEYTAKEIVLELLKKYAVGRRPPDDEFFREGNTYYFKPFKPLGVLSELPSTATDDKNVDINCNVPDCTFFCQSVTDYECHYNALHRYTCGQCKKILPNAHLLDLHLSEVHDSYFAAQVEAAKHPMYACFREECKYRSKDCAERRDHCIREHKFPHNFRFDKPSEHQLQRSKESPMDGGETDEPTPIDRLPQEDMAPPRCRKNYVFGHSRQRTFKPTKTAGPKCDILESNQMVVDLLESLPKE